MNGYNYIPNYFLYGFNNVEEVSVIGLPTLIGSYAFDNLSSAVFDIDFSEVTTINTYAFRNCTYLTKVNAPKLTYIGNSAFEGNKEIKLTTLEFDLLLLFISNLNKSFSRDEILNQVF